MYKDVPFTLSDMYRYGKGVTQDSHQAMTWYIKATKQGQAEAQCGIGEMYEGDQGVTRTYSQALHWYEMAADQGNAIAQCILGNVYEYGCGVVQDYSQAMLCYPEASKQRRKNRSMQCWVRCINAAMVCPETIGRVHYFGHGVPQNQALELEWLQKVADQELEVDQYFIGSLYEQGRSVKKDNIAATG
jgi:TPR repeat protein